MDSKDISENIISRDTLAAGSNIPLFQEELKAVMYDPRFAILMQEKFGVDISQELEDGVITRDEVVDVEIRFANKLIDEGYLETPNSEEIGAAMAQNKTEDIGLARIIAATGNDIQIFRNAAQQKFNDILKENSSDLGLQFEHQSSQQLEEGQDFDPTTGEMRIDGTTPIYEPVEAVQVNPDALKTLSNPNPG